jgi:hypothetical protein
MLRSLILIRFQSYEVIPLVIAFPSFSHQAAEDDTDISRISVQNKCYILSLVIMGEKDTCFG